jgi:hypothetical protein
MRGFNTIPLDDFNKLYCLVCSNRECSRSIGNSSLFDSRVKNWKKVLFENIQRIESGDMCNPKFINIENSGPIPEINSVQPKFETVTAPEFDNEGVKIEHYDLTSDVIDSAVKKCTEKEPEIMQINTTQINTIINKPLIIGNSAKTESIEQSGGSYTFDED